MGIGYKVPMNPIVSSKFYTQAILPKITYGLDILPLEENGMEKLEICHCNASKIFQQLQSQASSIGCSATIGWKSIRSYIDIMCLLFIWKILLLPMSCIYKILLLTRITQLVNDKTNIKVQPGRH